MVRFSGGTKVSQTSIRLHYNIRVGMTIHQIYIARLYERVIKKFNQ